MKTSPLSTRAQRRVSTRVASVLGVLLTTGAAFMACGGDDDGKTTTNNPVGGDPTAAPGTLKLLFAPMYSAFEPTHKYQLPVIIDGFTGAKFTASDPSKVDVENTATGATLTMKAAGTVTITATLGNEKGTSLLTITETSAAEWEKGNARYNSGIDALPTPDGGSITVANFFSNRDAKGACTTCHSKTAKLFQIEHTPQQTGGFSDTEIITIFSTGAKPDNARQRTNLPEFLWGMGHRWTVEEADKKGLVTYLRSLPPATQGEFDYGIRRNADGGLVDRDGNPLGRPPRPRGDGGTSTRRDSGSATASDAGATDGGVTPLVVDSAAPTEPADAGAVVQADAGV